MVYSRSIKVYLTDETGYFRGRHSDVARSLYEAKMGCPNAEDGNAYGLAAIDKNRRALPIRELRRNVDQLIKYAKDNPNSSVILCALPNYDNDDIGSMLTNPPENMVLPFRYKGYPQNGHDNWWYG